MSPSSEVAELMALDALGEATPEQQAELRRLLASQPELAAEHGRLTDTAAYVEALGAGGSETLAVPSHVLQRLEQARQAALDRSAAGQVNAGGAANVVAFDDSKSSLKTAASAASAASHPSRAPRRSTLTLLALAAVLALVLVPTALWLIPPGQPTVATASPALAPRGVTGMTQPTLVWDNVPDQKYDVWILPEGADQMAAPAIFVANSVRSPLQFASLQPGPANASKDAALKRDTRYLALVCLAGKGRMAGVTVSFQTAPAAIGAPPAPSDPATALAVARQSLAAGRPGDALMMLANLPENVRQQSDAAELEAEIRKSLQGTKVP